MIRMNRGYLILGAAWSIFVVSLFCRAVRIDVWKSEGDVSFGLGCALVFFPFWPSNLAILLLPLLAWTLRRANWNGWPQSFLIAFFLVSGGLALLMLTCFRSVYEGYLLWVASFFLASLGVWLLPLPASDRATEGATI